jgi:hypothetical protein
MRLSRSIPLALGLVLGVAAAARGGDAPTPRAVIEKSIKALGGQAKLTGYRASTCKAEGTVHIAGQGIAALARSVYQPPFQHCIVVVGYQYKVTTVLNGNRGWIRTNDSVATLTRDQVREYRESLHAEWVSGLIPLLDGKEFNLALLSEAKVDGQAAVVVRVRHKGYRDVKLFFSKESGFPLKWEVMIGDNGKLLRQEVFLGDYTQTNGVHRPQKIVTKRDGKDFTAWEVTEFRAHQKKVAESEFSKP